VKVEQDIISTAAPLYYLLSKEITKWLSLLKKQYLPAKNEIFKLAVLIGQI
jgi:hypothetical protein